MTKREDVIFDDIAAKIGEHFSDYVLIVRTKDGGVQWRGSNATWTIGAMRGRINRIEEREREDERIRIEDENR